MEKSWLVYMCVCASVGVIVITAAIERKNDRKKRRRKKCSRKKRKRKERENRDLSTRPLL